jgi:hypothetical protein
MKEDWKAEALPFIAATRSRVQKLQFLNPVSLSRINHELNQCWQVPSRDCYTR